MANIAKLSVLLSANTAKFSGGMKKASKHVRSFQSRVSSAKTAIIGLAGALGAYRAAAGLKRMVQDSMSSIDAVAKLSDKTGMATENIVAMRHAAALAGASQEDFDASLMRFVRRLGDAADGSGEAVAGLDALGLSARELSQVKPEQALGLVSDKLQEVANVGIRTDAAFKLFGDSAFRMMNFLTMGSEEFNKFRRDVDALGISFNKIDAQRIEEANDAIANLKAAFEGVANSIAITLAPRIKSVADTLRAATLSTIDGGEAQASSWGLVSESVSAVIKNVLKLQKLASLGITSMLGPVARALNWLATPVSQSHDPWQRVKDMLQPWKHRGEEGSWLDEFANAMDDQTQYAAKDYQKFRDRVDLGGFDALRKKAKDIAAMADSAEGIDQADTLLGGDEYEGIDQADTLLGGDEYEGPGDASKAFGDLLSMFDRVREDGPSAFDAASDSYNDMVDTMSGGPVGGAAAQGKFLGIGPYPSVSRGTPQPIGTSGFEAVQPVASTGTRGTRDAGPMAVVDQGTHDLLRALLTRGAVAVMG